MSPAAVFLAGLERAATLLESGDAVSAAEELAAANLAVHGVTERILSQEELVHARDLERRCILATADLAPRLEAQLHDVGQSRRALGAYSGQR